MVYADWFLVHFC